MSAVKERAPIKVNVDIPVVLALLIVCLMAISIYK